MGWLDRAQDVLGAAAGGVGSVFDWSEEHGKEWMGDLQYYIAKPLVGLPGESIVPGQGATDVVRAVEEGYNGFAGGRAAWELMQSDNPRWQRALLDVANPADPIGALGWATMLNAPRAAIGGLRATAVDGSTGLMRTGLPEFGQALRAPSASGEAAGLGWQALGYGIEGTSRAAWAGIRATEVVPETAFRWAVAKPIGFAGRQTLGRMGLFEDSIETQAGKLIGQLRLAVNESVSNTGSGLNRLSGNRRASKLNDPNIAPVSASPKLRGSILGRAAESAADRAWSGIQRLAERINPDIANTGFAQGVYGPITPDRAALRNIPAPAPGLNPNAIATFTSEDIDNFAAFSSAFIVGRMGQASRDQQLFSMFNAIDDLPTELASRTGYTPRNLEPLMPTILNRTGMPELPDAKYLSPTGFAERNASIKNTKTARKLTITPNPGATFDPETLPAELAGLIDGKPVDVKYSQSIQRWIDDETLGESPRVRVTDDFGNVFSQSDYSSTLPSGLKIGDELVAQGVGTVMGSRRASDLNDLASMGAGIGFRTGDELFQAGYRVTIKPTPMLKKADDLPDEWLDLRGVKQVTKPVTAEELVSLRALADQGLIKLEVKPSGGGLIAPSGYRELLEDPTKTGPAGLSFGVDVEDAVLSPREVLEDFYRTQLGMTWDYIPQNIKDEIWLKTVQGSYILMVQAAQQAYLPPSKIADLYLAASEAGEDVSNIVGRYAQAYKREFQGLSKKYPAPKSRKSVDDIDDGDEVDEAVDEIMDIAEELASSGESVIDTIARGDLLSGLNPARSKGDRTKLAGRYKSASGEMSVSPVSTTGGSAITPDNPTGYEAQSMAAIFNEDVDVRRAAQAVLDDPNASAASKNKAKKILDAPEAFEDDPRVLDSEGKVVERMRRNVHGMAMPESGVRRANPRGTYPINFATLMHAIRQGVDLNLNDRAVREWYALGVLEMDQLFGKGAIEDVYAFSLMVAATSAQAGPERNLELALRLWTIALMQNDPVLMAKTGMSAGDGTKLTEILNDLMRVGRGDVIGGDRVAQVGDESFTAGPLTGSKQSTKIKAGQTPQLGDLTAAHTRTSAQAVGQTIGEDPVSRLARGADTDMAVPAQGGSKFTDYGGSFVDQSVRDSIEKAYAGDPALRDEILDLWDRSQSQFTIDRHQNTLNAFNVVVKPFHYRVGRAMGQQATDMANLDPAVQATLKGMKLRPEDVQAITWYYTKGAKGFSRKGARFNDDLGTALKKRLATLQGTYEAGSEEQKIELLQNLIQEIVTDKHLVAPGKMTPSRRKLVVNELMQNVRKMKFQAERGSYPNPISYSYRLAEPKIYKDVAGNAGLEPLTIVRGYTTTLGGTPMEVNGAPYLSFDMPDDEIARKIDLMLQDYDSALNGPYANLIKIGFYPNGDRFSVDLNLLVGDEGTAYQIAKSNNQIAAFNNNTFDEIPTGGTGESPLKNGDQVNQFLSEQLTRRVSDNYQKQATDAAGDLGFRTLQPNLLPPELESLNFMLEQGLGYMSMQMRLFLDAFQSYQLRFALGGVGEKMRDVRKGVRAKQMKGITRGLADELINMQTPVRDPLISDEANRVLYDQGFEKGVFEGQTFGEVYKSLNYFIGNVQKGLEKQGIRWNPEATMEQKMKLLPHYSDKDQVKKVIKLLDKYELDPLADQPEKLAIRVMEREIEAQFGLKHDRLTGMKLVRAAWGEQALFTPRYHLGNLFGSWVQNIIGGRGPEVNPVEFARNVRMAAGNTKEGFLNPDNSKWVEKLDYWGFGSEIRQLNRVSMANMGVVSGNESTVSAVGKLATKIVGPRVGKVIGKPFEASKILSAGIEMGIRGNLAADVLDQEMNKRLPELARLTAERMTREGIDISDLTTDIFAGSAKEVQDRLASTGLSKGQAEHIARTYANFKRTSMDAGLDEVKKKQFSYEYTKADELVSKVVPFHYWASRALRYYVEETVRHPVFLYNYVRMTEGIERMNEEPGLSARQKGFLRIMQGPTGFSLLMNPDALMGVVKSLKMDNTYEPDGQTSLGGLIARAKKHGVGLFPWIDATMNYLGAYGDSFAPDPLGLRHRVLVGAAINEFRAYTGMEPGTAPYEAFNTKLREFISTNFDAATPDWLGQPVAVKNSRDGTMATASLDDLITTRVMANNPNITNGELVQILSDPDSPEYEEAYRQVANAGLVQQLLGVTVPTNIRVREDSRDSARAGMNLIREAAKEAGASPYDYEPSPADHEFYEAYRNLTGRDYKPGDMAKQQLRREIQTSTPEARRFVIQQHEYHSLGTPRAKEIQEKFGQILNGEWLPVGFQPGQYPEDVRWQIAREWVGQQPGYNEYLEMKQMRDLYLATHPEFGEYDSWRDSMYNVVATYGPTGLSYYRQKLSENNPGAKRYFDRRMRYIIEQNPQATPDEIRQQLDQATMSPDTWFAVSGRSMSQYDQAVPNAGGYYDPVVFNAPMARPQSGGPSGPTAPSNWVEALQTFGR